MGIRLPSVVVHLSKAAILDAALEILHDYGLADLTMRRLARALGVAPGALYWHVPSKQALLGDVAQRMMEPVQGARTCEDYCLQLFAASTSVRDGAEILAAAIASGTMERDVHAELAVLCAAALDAECGEGGARNSRPSRALARALIHLVSGAAWDQQNRETVRERLRPADTTAPVAPPAFDKELRVAVRALIHGWNR